MIKWKNALFFLVLASTSNASAQGVVFGAGAKTCGEFATSYANDPATYETAFYYWAQGWLSADSMWCDIHKEKADENDMQAYVDTHDHSVFPHGSVHRWNGR